MNDCREKGHTSPRTWTVGGNDLEPNLLLHTSEDHAGIAITEIKAGEKAHGLVLADHAPIELDVSEDIPLGHKIAVRTVSAGQPIILYGHPVGKALQTIRPGEHVHTHNMQSLRWP